MVVPIVVSQRKQLISNSVIQTILVRVRWKYFSFVLNWFLGKKVKKNTENYKKLENVF